ncbi:MAG TPA: 2OG-Fe(II) oxygenase [Thermoanaerobaculia bacterium]|nr:2OG-Fe(II) oxygenase [Thermoanaerobaculia bacterium]
MPVELMLRADPENLRGTFASARPFPHLVLDRLFPDHVLDQILAAFPSPRDARWQCFDNEREQKLGNLGNLLDIHPAVTQFLQAMNAHPMLDFLEKATGIAGLVPDPEFGGGGLHQIVRGGFLKVHADFNWHPRLKLDRRLNMLIYLNKDWREEYGGHLELWGREQERAEKSILPLFNRTVIFATTDSSYHGHPRPLSCPEGMTRKSVSLYYYSDGRPEEEKSPPHDTLFLKTPGTSP